MNKIYKKIILSSKYTIDVLLATKL